MIATIPYKIEEQLASVVVFLFCDCEEARGKEGDMINVMVPARK